MTNNSKSSAAAAAPTGSTRWPEQEDPCADPLGEQPEEKESSSISSKSCTAAAPKKWAEQEDPWVDPLAELPQDKKWLCEACKVWKGRPAYSATQVRQHIWQPDKRPVCKACQYKDEVIEWGKKGWAPARSGEWDDGVWIHRETGEIYRAR
jgi:hypothetical protein